jgi:hypothetical protein
MFRIVFRTGREQSRILKMTQRGKAKFKGVESVVLSWCYGLGVTSNLNPENSFSFRES